ncbi:hypothetical protein H0H92_011931 [Tricholoma furcatifolium]|nr:hypothetical protein H0H92_011931 [Tricholoma furcatifolium]
MAPISALFFPIAFATFVRAHGYVSNITIDGNVYKGNIPGGNSSMPSIIRLVNSTFPVINTTNPNLNCGQGASPSTSVGDAMPGSQLTFSWSGVDGGNWMHKIGPLMFYMASCGNMTCNDFDSTQAEWFKIAQQGRETGNLNGTWYQENIKNGYPANVTLPETLAPGNYLLRHEIIVLYGTTEGYDAGFFPSCTQLRVNGSQTGAPAASELVSFPGGYNDTDPGIFHPNVFNLSAPYPFPGPNIAAFVPASPPSNTSVINGIVSALESALSALTVSASTSTFAPATTSITTIFTTVAATGIPNGTYSTNATLTARHYCRKKPQVSSNATVLSTAVASSSTILSSAASSLSVPQSTGTSVSAPTPTNTLEGRSPSRIMRWLV